MISGGHENQICLLTAREAISFSEIVDIINTTEPSLGQERVRLEFVSPERYVELNGTDNIGGKPSSFYQGLVSWYDGIAKGDASTTDSLMSDLLGREAVPASLAIKQLLEGDKNYIWHQNYVDSTRYDAVEKAKRSC